MTFKNNAKKLALGKDYKVVKQVGGMKWVKLLTPESKDVEGEFMRHCVGGAGYENKDIYSLWDSKNRSHVTIVADDNKKTIQQNILNTTEIGWLLVTRIKYKILDLYLNT